MEIPSELTTNVMDSMAITKTRPDFLNAPQSGFENALKNATLNTLEGADIAADKSDKKGFIKNEPPKAEDKPKTPDKDISAGDGKETALQDKDADDTANEIDPAMAIQVFKPMQVILDFEPLEPAAAAESMAIISDVGDNSQNETVLNAQAALKGTEAIIMDNVDNMDDQQIAGALNLAADEKEKAPNRAEAAPKEVAGTPMPEETEITENVFSKVEEVRVTRDVEDASNLPADIQEAYEPELEPRASYESGTQEKSEADTDSETKAQAGAAEEKPMEKAEARQSFSSGLERASHSTATQEASNASDAVKLPEEVQAHNINNIAESMVKMRTSGKDEISIQMAPDFLGRLTIKLSMSGEGITAKLSTESLEAKSMINAQMVRLVEELKDKGINIIEMDIVHQEMSKDPNAGERDDRYNFKQAHNRGNRAAAIGNLEQIIQDKASVYGYSGLAETRLGLNNSMEFTA